MLTNRIKNYSRLTSLVKLRIMRLTRNVLILIKIFSAIVTIVKVEYEGKKLFIIVIVTILPQLHDRQILLLPLIFFIRFLLMYTFF